MKGFRAGIDAGPLASERGRLPYGFGNVELARNDLEIIELVCQRLLVGDDAIVKRQDRTEVSALAAQGDAGDFGEITDAMG